MSKLTDRIEDILSKHITDPTTIRNCLADLEIFMESLPFVTCDECAARVRDILCKGESLYTAHHAGYQCAAPGSVENGHQIMGWYGSPLRLCEAEHR